MPANMNREDQGIVLGDFMLVTLFAGEPDELAGDITFAETLLGDEAVREADPGGIRFAWITGYQIPSGLGLRLEHMRRGQGIRLIARKAAATVDDISSVSELLRGAVARVKGKPTVTGTNVGRLFLSGEYLDVSRFLKRSIEGSDLAQVVGGRVHDTQNITVATQFNIGGKSGFGQVRIERVEGRVVPIGRVEGASVEVNFSRPTTSKSAVYEALSPPLLHQQHAEAEKVFRRFTTAARKGNAK